MGSETTDSSTAIAAPTSSRADAGMARSPWRHAGLLAAALSLLCALLLGFQVIGLQYDECLHLEGAVHMLRSPGPPPFAYHRASWIPVGERWWPLMVIPYAGAIKNYVMIPPLALLGTSAWVCRAAAALLLALGIWGVTRLLSMEIGNAGAAAVGVILAVHPALQLHTLYDNGTVGVWIALCGLLAAAVARYRQRPTIAAAWLIGLLMGLGVWTRANFVWLLAAILVACALVYGRRLVPAPRHLAALTAGGLAGSAPLLLYQFASGWEILRSMRQGRVGGGIGEVLARRLAMLPEALLLDVENRQIWGGPAPPVWQGFFVLLLMAAGLALCLWPLSPRDADASRFRRASAIALLLFLLLMCTSRLNVAPHHLVTAVPLAAAVVVAAFQALRQRWRGAGWLGAGAALLFFGLAGYWNLTAAREMRRTGGIGSWSNAIFDVGRYLRTHHSGREVLTLDWGLASNLFVAVDGTLPVREGYWGATRQHSGTGPSWRSLVYRGGLFLANAEGHTHFPESSDGFRAALAASGSEFRRVLFRQRSGAPYAELFDVRPSVPSAWGVSRDGSNDRLVTQPPVIRAPRGF